MALIAITIISASVAGAYSYNYYQFYPAIQSLQLNIPSLTLNPNMTSLNAMVVFSLQNPTSYNGLSVTEFEPSFNMYWTNGTYVPAGGTIEYVPPILTLPAGKTDMYNLSFSGYLKGPGMVYSWIQQKQATVSDFYFNFTIGIFLSTFLNTYASLKALFNCGAQVGGGTCTELGVLLNSTPTSGGGGGGV